MLKRRVSAIEKRLAGLGGPTNKDFRLVFQFDGDPEPQVVPDKELLVVRVVNTRGEKAEAKADDKHVLRFDFGSSDGQTGRVNDKTIDTTDNSHPTERENVRK